MAVASVSKIYSAMAAIMAEIGPITKSKVNTAQNFKFRGIDDVYNHVNAIMAKNGVFSMPTVLEDRTEERQARGGGNLIYRMLKIKYTFFASDGSNVDCVVIGEGMDSGDKASNKAMSVAHKYALIQAFCIITEDLIDPDKESHETAPKEKKVDAVYVPFESAAKSKVETVYQGRDDQQQVVFKILQGMSAPEQYWEEIHNRLIGHPVSALKAIVDDVRLGL